MSIDISIIITAHHEGLLLHKTILSMLASATHLDKENTPYEFIISLDNPDKATKTCAERWRDDPRFTLYEVSFGNPADNRNNAIKQAHGSYVTLIDGDDLISDNWLLAAYELIKQQERATILRPAAHAQFGYEEKNLTFWFMRSSGAKATDAVQMAYWNLWTNTLFTTKDILLETPYRAPADGFGFEDYLFGADTRAKDISHLVVPETVLFYRRRPGSVSADHVGTILAYSDLLDVSYMKSLPLPTADAANPSGLKRRIKTTATRAYRFAFDTAKRIGPVNRAISPIARNILYRNNRQKIPTWLVQAWKNINSIENQLWPTKGEIAKAQFHPLSFHPYENRFGLIYQRLCHMMSGHHIDYLFLAPAMSGRGGTEKLIANYIRAIQAVHPTWSIAILSTQAFNQPTREYFKEFSVDLLDFGELTRGIGDYEKYIIWSRILIQSRAKRLHIVNGDYWYHWVAKHQSLLVKNNFHLYVSLFMREYVHEKGCVLSFADPDLVQVWPTVTKVFTDNKNVIDEALENNAFDKEKLVTHYQPQDISTMKEPKTISPGKPIRILWASRISHQKRPDILKKVADRLGDGFVVDAYGIIEKKQYKPDYFNDSTVSYKGPFNGLASIPTDAYDLYLYTSQTDGIPNILMEVAAAGLPIVASNVGGIREFIHPDDTGILAEMEDIDGYVTAIKSLTSDPEKAKRFVYNSQKLIRSQHSWDTFKENVKRDIT